MASGHAGAATVGGGAHGQPGQHERKGPRAVGLPAGVHPGGLRQRHRARQHLALPLHHRRQRWRGLRVRIPGVYARAGAGRDVGRAGGGASHPEEPGRSLQGARPWLPLGARWVSGPAHRRRHPQLLRGGRRLDPWLPLPWPAGAPVRRGPQQVLRRVRRRLEAAAALPGVVHGPDHGGGGRWHPAGHRAHQQSAHAPAAAHAGGADRQRPHAATGHARATILPVARLLADQHHDLRVRAGSGLLLAQPRHGRHAHLRLLHAPQGGPGQGRHLRGDLRHSHRPDGRPDDLPRARRSAQRWWAGPGLRRAHPAVPLHARRIGGGPGVFPPVGRGGADLHGLAARGGGLLPGGRTQAVPAGGRGPVGARHPRARRALRAVAGRAAQPQLHGDHRRQTRRLPGLDELRLRQPVAHSGRVAALRLCRAALETRQRRGRDRQLGPLVPLTGQALAGVRGRALPARSARAARLHAVHGAGAGGGGVGGGGGGVAGARPPGRRNTT